MLAGVETTDRRTGVSGGSPGPLHDTVQRTEYTVQNIQYRIYSTEYKVQRTDYRLKSIQYILYRDHGEDKAGPTVNMSVVHSPVLSAELAEMTGC